MTPENQYKKFLYSVDFEDVLILKQKIELKDPDSWKLKIINQFLEKNGQSQKQDNQQEASSIVANKGFFNEIFENSKSNKWISCSVEGNSMQGISINDGDKLIVERCNKLNENEVGIFKVNEQLYVKRYKTGNFDEIILKSHNINYPDIHLKKEDLKIIGKVISCIKDVK